jgi:PAS domain S-box-containing protein
MFHKVRRVIPVALVVTLLVVFVGLAFTLNSTRMLWRNLIWVQHSEAILHELQSVQSGVKDAETGQRGFLLTGQAEYLDPYRDSAVRLNRHLANLDRMVSDNPNQQRHLALIKQEVKAKMDELNATLTLAGQGRREQAMALVRSGAGKRYMQSVNVAVENMTHAENVLRAARMDESNGTYQFARGGELALAIAALLSITAMFGLLLRQINMREQQIRESESALHGVLGSVGDALITTTESASIIHMNSRACLLTGWDLEHAAGLPLHEVFRITRGMSSPPDEILDDLLRQKDAMGGGDNVLTLARRDGSACHVEASAVASIGRQGMPGGRLLIFRDVSERQCHLDQLERRELQFRTLAESIPQLCWMANANGDVLWYNQRWYDYTGMTPEEMLGWGWQKVQHPALLAEVNARWRASIRENADFEMIFPLLGKDGNYRDFLTRVVAVRDKHGQIVQRFGTNTDITAGRLVEKALRTREGELQSLADNSPDILCRFNREYRIIFINSAIERVTGQGKQKFVDRTLYEISLFSPVPLRMAWESAIDAVFMTGITQMLETELAGCDFATNFIAERDVDGHIANVLAVGRDITIEKAAQDSLRRADRRKDEFIATLAHELRNPLAPLRTGVQILRQSSDPATLGRTLPVMERQLGLMVRLIDDLLDVSRITSGKIVLQHELVSLQTIVDIAVETTASNLASRQIRLDVVLPVEPIWLEVDSARISQVISNILTNAAKFSPPHTCITLSGRQDSAQVCLSISDAGVGIAPDMLPRIFEMFAQIDRLANSAHDGLGIGLALSKQLIELHGGTIEAYSAGLNQGATFTIYLGAALPCEKVAEDARTRVAGTARRILVVDDNIDAAVSIATLIELLGHTIAVAHSGCDALSVAADFLPDWVFLDIGMPGMDGHELARHIRATPSFAAMKLVALTGWGSEEDRRRSRESGFDFHLVKPVDISQIESLID